MYGYEDGENIPRDLMLEAVGRVVEAVDLPVTADLEAGYGAGRSDEMVNDYLRTTRRARAVVDRVFWEE
jgi:2-methylisocitrate lyase-like PEP mutase family enzyme